MVAFERKACHSALDAESRVINDLDSGSSSRLGGHSQLDITTDIGGGFLLRTKYEKCSQTSDGIRRL